MVLNSYTRRQPVLLRKICRDHLAQLQSDEIPSMLVPHCLTSSRLSSVTGLQSLHPACNQKLAQTSMERVLPESVLEANDREEQRTSSNTNLAKKRIRCS